MINMKNLGFNVQAVAEPFNVLDEIDRTEIDEEPVYFCDLTDIVRKHLNWVQLLPRVVPFYGTSIQLWPHKQL